MQPTCVPTYSAQTQGQGSPSATGHGSPTCPVCTGSMVFLRNFSRCSQCGFCICVSCGDLPGPGESLAD